VALHLEIVTPVGAVVATDTDEVILPGKLGEFGVLDGHVPFLSALRPGVVRYRQESKWERLAVGSGFAEVGAGRKVLVLTDSHARPSDVDVAKVTAELGDLDAQLKAWTGPVTPEHDELRAKVAWAQARLDVRSESGSSKAQ
jgi:F-type H+-transporting ATPase subunit epsilon